MKTIVGKTLCAVFARVSKRSGGKALAAACLLSGAAPAQAAINDPAAYWSFDDAGRVLSNAVISSPYHDASALFGTPTAGLAEGASGLVGNALVLDGACGIRLPYHQDNLGTSFTLSFWYWQLTNDTRQCVYQSRDTYDITYEAQAGANASFASFVGQELAGVITTGLKEWTHIAHAFSTSNNIVTLSVYSNGVLKLTKAVASNSVFHVYQIRGLHVGAYRSATGPADGRCFKGMIDEVALWRRALSAEEVQAVYQRGASGQKLEFTSLAPPAISLAGMPHVFTLNVAEGLPDGMFNSGWLLNGIQDPAYPFTAADTAGDMLGYVPDTAGNAGGPFDAQIADVKWQVPLTTALRQLPQSDFTVETWFRTTSAAWRNILLGNYYNANNGVVNLELYNTNNVRFYQCNSGGTVADFILPVTNLNTRNGQWHHLAGVRTNNQMILYLDGKEVGTTNAALGSYALAGDYFYLGRDIRTTGFAFSGDQGHTRLWTRALSTNELANIVALKLVGGGDLPKTGLLAEYALYNPFNAIKANPWYRISLSPPQLKQIQLTNFTCEAVFRTTNTGRSILLGSYTNNITGAFSLELHNGNYVRLWQCNTAGTVLDVNVSADSLGINTRNGAWHRLAAVRRDGKAYLFVDGRQLTSATDSLGPYLLKSDYLDLGRDERVGTLPLNGDLGNVRIWSRALSTNEVAGLAASNSVPVDGLVAQYAPMLTNNLHTAGLQGSRFLRSFTTATNSATLVFTGLPRHKQIGLGLLLAQLDSLDPVANNDHFEIRVDGAEVLSVGLGPDQGGEPQVSTNAFRLFGAAADAQVFKNTMAFGGEDLFFCGTDYADYKDHVYDLSSLEVLQAVPHTAGTLTLEFLGVQNSVGESEGFGIDRIQLTVYPLRGTLLGLQ